MPVAQLVQTDADMVEYIPMEQAPETAERPVVAQYDPALHTVHVVSPFKEVYEPTEQLVQLDDDTDAEYMPTEQLEQDVAEDAE